MLVDSHCHLDFEQFDGRLDEVIEQAKNHGVTWMQTICTRISEFHKILPIAKRYDNIWCSVGIHPNNVADEPPASAQQIIALAKDSRVIGIGETGLDYYYDYSPKHAQQLSFIEHIKASQDTGLPLIVHTRDADDDTIAILRKHMQEKPFNGLIHCFSTGRKLAEAAIEMGMYVSISGIVTFKKSQDLQAIVKDLPLTSLLVETDAPYLAPVPMRGKTNEPAFTKYTAEFIAKLKNIDIDEVAKVTTDNFFTCFTQASRNGY